MSCSNNVGRGYAHYEAPQYENDYEYSRRDVDSRLGPPVDSRLGPPVNISPERTYQARPNRQYERQTAFVETAPEVPEEEQLAVAFGPVKKVMPSSYRGRVHKIFANNSLILDPNHPAAVKKIVIT